MRTIAHAAFPPEEYGARLHVVHKRMAEAGLDLILVTAPENICYLSGFESAGYFNLQSLLVTHSAEPVLITRELELGNAAASCVFNSIGYRDHENPVAVMAHGVEEFGAGVGRIGVESRSRSISAAHISDFGRRLPHAMFADSFGVVEGPRLLKSELELSYIRRAGAIAAEGMSACRAAVRLGSGERDIAAAAYPTMINAGSEWTGAPVFIASGPRSARAHATWSDRVLSAGDPIFLETNASVRRYHAALMRPACVPPIPARFRAMCDASRAGLEAALETLRPGVAAATVDCACRRAIEKAGWGESFRLRTGYSVGIGFENFGEGSLFSLHAENEAEIQEGMVLHLVPYLAEFDFAGCAFSETIIVTKQGAEPVSAVPRDMG